MLNLSGIHVWIYLREFPDEYKIAIDETWLEIKSKNGKNRSSLVISISTYWWIR